MVVANLRSGIRVLEGLEMTLGLLNVTDEDYRIHGSGINEPGFGVVLAARYVLD